jgi:hypothetical protein
MRILIGIGLCFTAFVAVWFTLGRSTPPVVAASPDVERPEVAPLQQRTSRGVGSATCSGQSCHGASVKHPIVSPVAELAQTNDRQERWPSSYVVWLTQDRHAHAYQTLRSEKSTRMVEQLSRGTSHDATQETQCLACHANPTLAKPANRVPHLLEEGVSCEACHGNANEYLATHMNWTNGAERRNGYAASGMTTLNHLHTRAENCLGCHLGAPETAAVPRREVTHDLLAAGHPRLTFELASSLRLLPPHWSERDRFVTGSPVPRAAEFEGQVWNVGQFTQTQMTLALTQARLDTRRWPELAEFNCVACHHPLEPSTGAVKRTKTIGQLVWLQPELGLPHNATEFQERQNQLTNVAEQLARPPDLQHLKADLQRLIESCRQSARLAAEAAWTPANTDALVNDLARRADSKSKRWDEAKWLFDAAMVSENGRRDRRRMNGQLVPDLNAERTLHQIYNALKFDPKASMYNYSTPDSGAKLRLLFAELWPR